MLHGKALSTLALAQSVRGFPHEWLSQHINSKEMYPLYHVLRQFCARAPDNLRHAQVLINVDNQSLVRAFKRGQFKDSETRAVGATVRFSRWTSFPC